MNQRDEHEVFERYFVKCHFEVKSAESTFWTTFRAFGLLLFQPKVTLLADKNVRIYFISILQK